MRSLRRKVAYQRRPADAGADDGYVMLLLFIRSFLPKLSSDRFATEAGGRKTRFLNDRSTNGSRSPTQPRRQAGAGGMIISSPRSGLPHQRRNAGVDPPTAAWKLWPPDTAPMPFHRSPGCGLRSNRRAAQPVERHGNTRRFVGRQPLRRSGYGLRVDRLARRCGTPVRPETISETSSSNTVIAG